MTDQFHDNVIEEAHHMTTPQTAIPYDKHRGSPLSAVWPWVDQLHRSGVVDQAWFWDELSAFIPSSLWRSDIIPMARLRDAHSTHDPFVVAAYSLARNPGVGVRISTDAIRNSPAELMRTMMSLASATEGDAKAVCSIGAGELRQTGPFGFKRSEGLSRLEDIFQLVHRFWDSTEPFDFDGNHWTMRGASLGSVRGRRPEFWALGGGPKLIEIAACYADGFETASPQTVVTPDEWAKTVRRIQERVEHHGRDPQQFGFGIWLVCAVHDDPDVLARAFENPYVKAFAAIFGRLNQADWHREGMKPPMEEDWHYAMRWTPFSQTAQEVDQMVSGVSAEMASRALHHGSVAEIAARAREFVDAGATFVGIADVLPIVLDLEDAQKSFDRSLQLCGALKGATAAGR